MSDFPVDATVAQGWQERAEAAEVRVAALEGALRGLLEYVDLLERNLQPNMDWSARIMVDARETLAAVHVYA